MTQIDEALETPTDARDRDAAALLDYLRERDVACPLCRYNLRGLRASRCPECGRELTLGVWLAEPRMGAWVVALVPSLLAAGVGVLLLFAMIAEGWNMIDGMPFALVIAMGCFLVFIPIAAAVLVLRRRFMRLAERRQWVLGALLLLASAGAFAAYLVGMSMFG